MPTVNTRLLDGTAWISAHGEIDLDNAYVLREAVDQALNGDKPGRIVVDLTHIKMIDSVGIGVLVACFYAAAASGVHLALAHPSTIVYRQLWVSGLVGLFGLPTPPADPSRRHPAAV